MRAGLRGRGSRLGAVAGSEIFAEVEALFVDDALGHRFAATVVVGGIVEIAVRHTWSARSHPGQSSRKPTRSLPAMTSMVRPQCQHFIAKRPPWKIASCTFGVSSGHFRRMNPAIRTGASRRELAAPEPCFVVLFGADSIAAQVDAREMMGPKVEAFGAALKKASQAAENTVVGYRRDLLAFRTFLLERAAVVGRRADEIDLAEVTADHIRSYLAELMKKGQA